MIDEAAKLTLMSLKVFRYVYIKFRPTLLSFIERKHLVGDNLWEKFGLHPPTIAKVRFSTFYYETGQHRSSICQNRANLAPGVVLKVVFHFVRIKNIQFYTKNL